MRLATSTEGRKVIGLSRMQWSMMKRMYAEAGGDAARLPWHRDTPSNLLLQAIEERGEGHALDVGCGSGVFAHLLASRGFSVTAIDVHPDAVVMAKEQSRRGPSFRVIEGDALAFDYGQGFDLIYDSGCLHNFSRSALSHYVQRIEQMLNPGGELVLEHWGKRHALDWLPIGPRRRSRNAIQSLFAPTLRVVAYESELFDVPLILGAKVLGAAYRIQRCES